MDSEQSRPHNRSSSSNNSTATAGGGGGGELFICFTSRLSSSSSMKISSKSILSPGRTREPSQISLSSSLSRRLRTNGSMKGGQASPMFPSTAGKKKGCAFENPEPSSPKVTCIGQVRVKTKKQGKKMRSRSKRRGEVSFRRVEQSTATGGNSISDGVAQISRSYSQTHFNQQRNQKWVHLPMTICEALRTFGAELNCFLPCRSSCMSSSGDKKSAGSDVAGERNGSSNGSSCGAVFARWLVAVQDGEGKGREIELVVGEEEPEPEPEQRRSQRRHVFENIDIGLESFEEKKQSKEDGEEANRVSICVPPKNALLLMRCRSDPVKMAALANRFWESPLQKDDKEELEEDDEEEEAQEEMRTVQLETEHSKMEEDDEEEESVLVLEPETVGDDQQVTELPEQKASDLVTEETEEEQNPEPENQETEVNSPIEDCNQENQETEVVTEEPALAPEETALTDSSLVEVLACVEEQEIDNLAENLAPEVEEEDGDGDVEENRASVPSSPLASVHSEPEPKSESDSEYGDGNEEDEEKSEAEAVAEEAEAVAEMAVRAETEESKFPEESREEEEETTTRGRPEPEEPNPTTTTTTTTHEYEPGRKSNDSVSSQCNHNRLPDCLLLMMCEPKLSMEVSKETWVCSTDFIRWLPERPPVNKPIVAKTDVPDEPKNRTSTDSNPAPPPPHPIKPSRPSPNPNRLHQPPRSSCSFPARPPANPIEPKLDGAKAYEPFALTRCKSEPVRSASKLLPDACFWTNRKLEPHRPGIGATGVGC